MKQNVYTKLTHRYAKLLMLLLCLAAGQLLQAQDLTISGKVTNDQGQPLPGATVAVKGSTTGVTTGDQGIFTLHGIKKDEILIVSSIGYQTREVVPQTDKSFTIVLKKKVNELDETIVRAYGTTTRRLNTGSISKVTAEEIERQPVSNPLAALQGRVPGLVVTQSSGVPGSSFKVQIRGQNSIFQGSDPLFVIDGVPYAPGNTFLNQLYSAAVDPTGESGLSPLNLINPDAIASIEILKDADATAIYGSRGANGVIIITTKKGQPGKLRVSADVYSGISTVSEAVDFLNTKQYLEMRREAFANDGLIPNDDPQSNGYAPDLTVWDTTRYTDLKKLLIGGNARFTNAHASISGGNEVTRFLLGAGYRKQTNVFPGDFSDYQGSAHLNVDYSTVNKKFSATVTANYNSETNYLPSADFTRYLYLPPDIPPLFDSSGNLNWQAKGVPFNNPLSYLFRQYKAQTENMVSNLQLNYRILPGLTLKANAGYNTTLVYEQNKVPGSSIDPQSGASASADFANRSFKSWLIEPQIEFRHKLFKGYLDILIGSTWQELNKSGSSISGEGYTSDALLGSVVAAGDISARNSSIQYRYTAVFGRINYNWSDKYILNLSGRRDGSSRFGPGRQFANFAAGGFAWIFSEETFFKNAFRFISFGKFRGSYGTAGNDQIGDYQYLDAWTSTYYPYNNVSGLYPVRLSNPDYGWEINRKLEAAVELGLLKNKVLFSVSFFRNHSGNQLINYSLPIQTGFNSVNKNFDAVVQNKGWEFSIDAQNIKTRNLSWETGFHITINRNKLIRFPGLASSSYASTYVTGQSLSVLKGFKFEGVDPVNGIYTYQDVDKDGKIAYPGDYIVLGNLDPQFYGGFSNTFSYKGWSLNIFLQFRKQIGKNYLFNQLGLVPGSQYNQATIVLNRWQRKGDKANIQKFTTTPGTTAYNATKDLPNSNGIFSDASFIRGKNLSLCYTLPSVMTESFQIEGLKVYITAQNLFTLSNYMGADPEIQNIYVLPPLKTITLGINLKF